MKGPAKGMRSGPNHNQRAAGMPFAEVASKDTEREISMVQPTPTVQRYD